MTAPDHHVRFYQARRALTAEEQVIRDCHACSDEPDRYDAEWFGETLAESLHLAARRLESVFGLGLGALGNMEEA